MQQDISLQPYNTFGIDVAASRFITVGTLPELRAILRKEQPALILGGGSNLLLTQPIDGLVLKNDFRGIERLKESAESVTIRFGAGENWHEMVLWAIKNNLGGIENLSLIPGTLGAAPIQNIGAYGIELKDVFIELEAVYLRSGRKRIFKLADCNFGYRDSIFKRRLKGKVFITSVTLRLTKKHQLKMSYGAIQQVLEEKKITKPTIKAISDAIIQIRSSKLPDPKVLGNSGSFFKNPEISQTKFKKLLVKFPETINYPLPDGRYKIPAGWLIEQCGWKGKRVGNTGAHAKQALVLVNYDGKATGQEVYKLALDIQSSVKQKFDILLTPEVNVI